MSGSKQLKTIVLFCGLLLFYPLCSEGRDAKFADLLVTNNAKYILVYGRLENFFTDDIESAILAGVPTTLTFLFDFYQERSFWPDKKLVHGVVKHTIKYDNVKKIFYLYSTDESVAATFQTLDNAKRAIGELDGVAVIPINVLMRGKPYYLMVKAQLEKMRLPSLMESIFFFVSFRDFETGWYMQRVKY